MQMRYEVPKTFQVLEAITSLHLSYHNNWHKAYISFDANFATEFDLCSQFSSAAITVSSKASVICKYDLACCTGLFQERDAENVVQIN